MLVPVRAEHGVEEHPLAVDGAIEGVPAAGDFHVGLVQVPGAAGVAAPLRSPPIREQRGEADLPGADRLVADLEAALEEQLGDVPEAELIAETPEHGEQHDVDRVLEIVERGAGPLVEAPPAGLAAEPPGAERGAALAPRRRRGCTVWTSHQRPLTVPWMRRARGRRALRSDRTLGDIVASGSVSGKAGQAPRYVRMAEPPAHAGGSLQMDARGVNATPG